jgi:branched-chain amino acid transport system substrate-binding protein
MKKGKLQLTLLSLFVVASMLLAACGAETATNTPAAAPPTNTVATANTPMAPEATATTGGAAPSGGVIKIGVDLPTSGADASDGVPARNGAELAIEQANAAGGVTIGGTAYKLEMYALDDAVNGVHNPEQGAKNAQAFVADPDVLAVVGPFNSNVARAIMPILNNGNVPQISPANTNETLTKPEYGLTKDYRPTGKVTYFRVCTTDDIQGPAAADYMYDKLGAKNIYILDDTETYGKGLADNVEKRFKERGGTIAGHEGVPKGTQDFRTILTKAAGTKPDALFYGGTTSNGLALARKQMADAGLNIPFMGGDGIVETEFTKVGGDAANGSYGTVAAVNAATLPEAKQFLADYKARFNEDVGAYSANAYEATNIIIAGLKAAGKKDREAVRAAIAATKDFKGVIGMTSFDENGDTTNRWISIYEVKDAKWSFVDQLKIEDK